VVDDLTEDFMRFDRERRAFMQRCAGYGALGGSMLILAVSPPAAAKAAKSELQYQDEPREGKSCSACRFFIPDAKTGTGRCAVVEGSVRASGWCTAFSPLRKT
jgi:hypothetical protein